VVSTIAARIAAAKVMLVRMTPISGSVRRRSHLALAVPERV